MNGRTRDHGYNLVFEPAWCQPTTGEGIIGQTDVDMIFIDYGNDDFSIIASSPAVDAATDVSEFWPTGIFPDFDFNQDIRGVARPQQSGWDIGPYEYSAVGMSNVELRMTNAPLLIPNPASWSAVYPLHGVRVLELDDSMAEYGTNGVFLLQDGEGIRKTLIKD